LLGRGADLSRVDHHDVSNILHLASVGNDCDCINWVLANTNIDINSTDHDNDNAIRLSLRATRISANGRLDAAKLLLEKGANLFMENVSGVSSMDEELGPQVFQHAKDLIWKSVKPLLLLSASCSTSNPQSDPSRAIPPSLINALSITGIVRDYIAQYLMRTDIIIRDPSIP
jgi:hypothetical protein